MLKGHVFSKQIFGNPIFALFINTFLNGKNGVSNNYKNGMSLSYSGSTVTVNSGAVCIQGRFLEEDTSTPVAAGTDNSYCKLVIEINLNLENTESEFNQASYKVVKSSGGYPSLTQTNIVKNNSGIYQYELARFRTTSSGIINFQDMRTFLDFDSIYDAIQAEYQSVLQELQDELANVEDGSAYWLKAINLVTEDLNNYTTEGFYFGYGGNSVLNKPEGVNNFSLMVIKMGQFVQKQILHYNDEIYTRVCDNGTWTNWILISITSKQLHNQNLNDYHSEGFYFGVSGNNCTNRPSGVDYFGLKVQRISNSGYRQILYTTNSIYSRNYDGISQSWSDWSLVSGELSTTLNLSTNGWVKVVRKGGMVTIYSKSDITKGDAYPMGTNSANLPDWAIPAETILDSGTIRTGVTTDMNGNCFGYGIVHNTNKFSLVANAPSNQGTIYVTMSYPAKN